MLMAVLILVFSTALFFFYCQVTIHKILRRTFEQAYFRTIVAANGLEFPVLRNAFQGPNVPLDYAHVRTGIKCDFLALRYLLKNAANLQQRYSWQERVLMLYFRLVLASLAVRHRLHLSEKPAVLGLAEILQHFANVVGQRVNSVRLENLTALEYISTR
jgi:hypothetical protein